MEKNPAHKLVEHFEGIRQAADHFGMSYESMRRWHRDGIPLECALDAELKSGGIVTAEDVLAWCRATETS